MNGLGRYLSAYTLNRNVGHIVCRPDGKMSNIHVTILKFYVGYQGFEKLVIISNN